MSERSFDPRVLASLTSGILMVDDFGKVHEAMEFICGHPVWTHELPSLSRTLVAPAILARYPDMPKEGTVADWQACADGLLDRHGESVPMHSLERKRVTSPVQTIHDVIAGKEVETKRRIDG